MKKSKKELLFVFGSCVFFLLGSFLLTSCSDNRETASKIEKTELKSPEPISSERYPVAENGADEAAPEMDRSAKNGGVAKPEMSPEVIGRTEDATLEMSPAAGNGAGEAAPAMDRSAKNGGEGVAPERYPAAKNGGGEAALERYPAAENGGGEAAIERYPAARVVAEAAPMINKYDQYKVELGADSIIKIPGIPGELRVWIGFPEYEATFPEDMSRAHGSLPAVGETARVRPFSTGLKIEPKESLCMKIHPTGSEVRFELIPIKEGVFKVGADVHLFDSDDCSGAPIPKAAATLQVEVKVDRAEIANVRKKELWEVFWEKFLQFWGAVVALFFGLVLFLLRNQLKKWFGYRDDR